MFILCVCVLEVKTYSLVTCSCQVNLCDDNLLWLKYITFNHFSRLIWPQKTIRLDAMMMSCMSLKSVISVNKISIVSSCCVAKSCRILSASLRTMQKTTCTPSVFLWLYIYIDVFLLIYLVCEVGSKAGCVQNLSS